jgi:hypothetical protein
MTKRFALLSLAALALVVTAAVRAEDTPQGVPTQDGPAAVEHDDDAGLMCSLPQQAQEADADADADVAPDAVELQVNCVGPSCAQCMDRCSARLNGCTRRCANLEPSESSRCMNSCGQANGSCLRSCR